MSQQSVGDICHGTTAMPYIEEKLWHPVPECIFTCKDWFLQALVFTNNYAVLNGHKTGTGDGVARRGKTVIRQS